MDRVGIEQVLVDSGGTSAQGAEGGAGVLEGGELAVTGQIPAVTASDSPVSVNLDNHDVPFQQPGPRSVLLDTPTGWDWRRFTDRVGRWPILILVAVAVLAGIFAAFISRNSQSLSDDLDSRVAQAIPEGALDDAAIADTATADAGDGDDDAGTGRSTGSAGDVGALQNTGGLLVEPDEELTTDISWATTIAPPTTAAQTSSTQDPSSTTTPSTSTKPVETTTSTSTTTTEQALVVALSPGRPAGQEPERITSDEVVLQAQGRESNLRYRFKLYVLNKGSGHWELDRQSRFRSRDRVDVDLGRYEGQTVGWTVVVRQRDGSESPETAPLYFVVGEDDVAQPVDVGVANGGFEDANLGGTWAMLPDGNVGGWSSSLGVIEVWANGFDPSVQAASGSQFIELNSTGPSTISQIVAVNPGMTIRWSLAHQSRQGAGEAIEVRVRPVGGRASWSGPYTSSLGRWVWHEGSYEVPGGVNEVEISIRSASGGSVGNFIDDVRIDAR